MRRSIGRSVRARRPVVRVLSLATLVCVLGVTSLAGLFEPMTGPGHAPLLEKAESPLSTGAGDTRARGSLGHLANKERALLDAIVDLPEIRTSALDLYVAGALRRGFPDRLRRPPIG